MKRQTVSAPVYTVPVAGEMEWLLSEWVRADDAGDSKARREVTKAIAAKLADLLRPEEKP